MRAEGADLRLCDDYDDAERRAKAHGGRGFHLTGTRIPDVIAGAGTVGLEIVEDWPEVDTDRRRDRRRRPDQRDRDCRPERARARCRLWASKPCLRHPSRRAWRPVGSSRSTCSPRSPTASPATSIRTRRRSTWSARLSTASCESRRRRFARRWLGVVRTSGSWWKGPAAPASRPCCRGTSSLGQRVAVVLVRREHRPARARAELLSA